MVDALYVNNLRTHNWKAGGIIVDGREHNKEEYGEYAQVQICHDFAALVVGSLDLIKNLRLPKRKAIVQKFLPLLEGLYRGGLTVPDDIEERFGNNLKAQAKVAKV